MTIALESMAVAMPEVAGHPNRVGFRGVLTVVDVASQRAPSGAKGHSVVLTRRAAEAALPSLLGMALDYAPSFDRHDVRSKVGVITDADIVGRNLEVGGYLFAKDFPEVVKEIAKSRRSGSGERSSHSLQNNAGGMRSADGYAPGNRSRTEGSRLRSALSAAARGILSLRAEIGRISAVAQRQQGGFHSLLAETQGGVDAELGMSYEVTDVQLADTRSHVWILTKVTFTGAAILRRDKAAYQDTWIELSR
jgi:hypothetical protein